MSERTGTKFARLGYAKLGYAAVVLAVGTLAAGCATSAIGEEAAAAATEENSPAAVTSTAAVATAEAATSTAAEAVKPAGPEAAQAASPAVAAAAGHAEVDATRIAAGRELFNNWSCNACHALSDAKAAGAVGPSLDGDANLTEEFIIGRVANGQGAMPAFGGQLSDKEIADLAYYLTKVAKKS